MSNKPLQITTPVGRLVGGSIYEPRTTDYDGKPLVVKSGPNAGQPRKEYSFGIAIPKTPGVQHWANEPWGAQVWALAQAAFPNGETQRPDFAWKITDGDSTVPNKKGIKPCDREGFRGCYVIWFSGGTSPRVYNANGTELHVEPDYIKPGYYIQVAGNVKDNKPSQSPGLYWNHSLVALSAYGEEIVFGPDVSAVGFGQGVSLPAGATMAPTTAGIPATGAIPPAPMVPPPAVPAAPAAPARQMTALANGATYEQMIAAGWTDATLIAGGMMAAPVPVAPTVPSVPAPLPVGSAPAGIAPAPTAVAPPPSPVTPNPDMRAVPAAPVGIAPPPAPPRLAAPEANNGPVGYRMANPAENYGEFIRAGWNDALLIQHGKLIAA